MTIQSPPRPCHPFPRLLLLCLVLAYLVFAGVYAWVLVDHGYETLYLGLGSLALRGELDLYQDELPGQWVPLPFYVYGLTQLVAGPSLLAARLLAVAVGLAALVLMFAIARRWAGPTGAAVALALFCAHGLVLGYYATAHFAPLVAVLHLAAIYVVFCTAWPRRDLIAMAIVSLLFLTKPHYWPTIPFVLAYLVWRATSRRIRVALVAVALAPAVLFFAWDPDHLKLLAFVPVLRDWVKPLGFQSFMLLQEDTGFYHASDYVTVSVEAGVAGQLARVVGALGFLVKRYALWFGLLAVLGTLALASRRGRTGEGGSDWTAGMSFTFWLFWYLVAWQFLAVGPYTKQAFAYVGAIAPLLAIVLGGLFAAAWRRPDLGGLLRAGALAGVILVIVASPFVHRSHWLPRTVSRAEATIPSLARLADALRARIPAADRSIFLLGNPLPVHLAGRQAFLRQSHQPWEAFSSSREPAAYARTGMWGPAEAERWLGVEATWAIVQTSVLDRYRRRAPYAQPVARIEALLAQHFRLVDTLPVYGSDVFKVYRRRD